MQCLRVCHCVHIPTTLPPLFCGWNQDGSVFNLLWTTCVKHGSLVNIFLQRLYFSPFGYFPRRRIAPSQGHSNFSLLRNCPDACHDGCTKLCSYQSSSMVLCFLHPCQFLKTLAFYKWALRWFLTKGLMGISQGGIEHLSLELGTISTSSLAGAVTSSSVDTF